MTRLRRPAAPRLELDYSAFILAAASAPHAIIRAASQATRQEADAISTDSEEDMPLNLLAAVVNLSRHALLDPCCRPLTTDIGNCSCTTASEIPPHRETDKLAQNRCQLRAMLAAVTAKVSSSLIVQTTRSGGPLRGDSVASRAESDVCSNQVAIDEKEVSRRAAAQAAGMCLSLFEWLVLELPGEESACISGALATVGRANDRPRVYLTASVSVLPFPLFSFIRRPFIADLAEDLCRLVVSSVLFEAPHLYEADEAGSELRPYHPLADALAGRVERMCTRIEVKLSQDFPSARVRETTPHTCG
ncbi:MAG: hypothetical protein BJ554DRAFT_7956 [Olpidium bornovanus]|uniref:Uncharacterized protein n=1 Tax=Olpidium bornovanus TaxID=278681 RepID=A0A8H8DIV9_9FUNG|nr:MAG: hypothetical protein BJ554DRAFT_7956 [Olpidium bornovanus]